MREPYVPLVISGVEILLGVEYTLAMQATLQPKLGISEADNTSPQLKERLFEAEQALRRITRQLEDLQGAHAHITTQLQQLALPGDAASSDDHSTWTHEDAGHLLSKIKAQMLDMWHEIERLQQVCLHNFHDRIVFL